MKQYDFFKHREENSTRIDYLRLPNLYLVRIFNAYDNYDDEIIITFRKVR